MLNGCHSFLTVKRGGAVRVICLTVGVSSLSGVSKQKNYVQADVGLVLHWCQIIWTT